MKKILFVVVCVYILLVVLMPKVKLYFQVEQQLKKELKLNINNEKVKDNLLFLSISGADILSSGISVAKVKNVKIYPFLIVNHMSIENITMQKSIQKILNMKVRSVGVTHNILQPLKLSLDIELIANRLHGYVDLKTKKIKLFYKQKINGFGMFRQYVQKTKDGYKLELSF